MNHPARVNCVLVAVVGPCQQTTPTRFVPTRVRRSLSYGPGVLSFVSPSSSPIYSRRIIEESEPEGDDEAEDGSGSEEELWTTI